MGPTRVVLMAIGTCAVCTTLFAQTAGPRTQGEAEPNTARGTAAPAADANGFKVGDTVEINTGFGWMRATILAINGNNYRVRSQVGVDLTKTYPSELRRIGPPAQARPAAGARGTQPGKPPRPGLSSCAGKIEGRYVTTGAFGGMTIEFRSGRAIMKDAIGENDTELECWTGGDKIYLHKPGDSPSQDMPIDINDDGTLQTPMGEMRKRGK
jgi:hypothetical protein